MCHPMNYYSKNMVWESSYWFLWRVQLEVLAAFFENKYVWLKDIMEIKSQDKQRGSSYSYYKWQQLKQK